MVYGATCREVDPNRAGTPAPGLLPSQFKDSVTVLCGSGRNGWPLSLLPAEAQAVVGVERSGTVPRRLVRVKNAGKG
jgi:hypothetical protein